MITHELNHTNILYYKSILSGCLKYFFMLRMKLKTSQFVIFLNKLPEYPKCYIHDIPVDLECLQSLYRVYDERGKT